MAKSSGMAWTTLNVDDVNSALQGIKNDVTNLDFSTPQSPWDVTGIDKSAIERLLLLTDFTTTITGVFNDTLNQEHSVFQTVGLVAVNRRLQATVNGVTLNQTGVLFSEYNVVRAADAKLTFTATGSVADGAVPTWT